MSAGIGKLVDVDAPAEVLYVNARTYVEARDVNHFLTQKIINGELCRFLRIPHLEFEENRGSGRVRIAPKMTGYLRRCS